MINGNLATSEDMEKLRAATQTDIAGVKGTIANKEAGLIRWMIDAMIAQTGLIVGLIN